MIKRSILLLAMTFFIVATSDASGHSLFNSAEQTIGNNRVQIATLPEFPQINEESTILLRVTDRDYNEIEDFTMGMRVFFNQDQIKGYTPQMVQGSHWEESFTFETSGNHIVKVDLYDDQGITTYTFNLSTQSPFGYIFFIAITIGASLFTIMMVYIYLPNIIKTKLRR